LNIFCLNAYSSVSNKLKSLDHIRFTGPISFYQGQIQIINPECHPQESELTAEAVKIQYPTVSGVSPALLKKLFGQLPEQVWEGMEENLPQEVLLKRQLLGRNQSFKILHGQKIPWEEKEWKEAEQRLIYEEFFVEQIKIILRRQMVQKKLTAAILTVSPEQKEKLFSLFSYVLTADQIAAVEDIVGDFSKGHPMMRLLQGDVGCGKTSVALIAAAITSLAGKQVAIMCPTESLAWQHLHEFKKILGEDFPLIYLVGSTPASEKKQIQKKLLNGEIKIVIGTHSLIQDDVEFAALGLAIIDEQHRFGVEQRLKLVQKDGGVHCLIMTATPIPRSLRLTQFGDLDISTIKTMPLHRKAIKTRIVNPEHFSQFLNFLSAHLALGEQGYIVVPAINESENPDLNLLHLHQVHDKFKKLYPQYRVEFLHGQMKGADKEQIFDQFRQGKIQLLVATTVIEVGINVINATVLAIMNPERFGLSSLHQLRGRVGRGEKTGFCFLINDGKISSDAKSRLKVIEDTTDGFRIAEEDLVMRGEGDLFGVSQSGSEQPRRLANIILHSNLLQWAQHDARELSSQNHPVFQALLKHYAQDLKVLLTV